MKNFFANLYERMLTDPWPVLNKAFHLLAILIAASLAWWILNKILTRLKKRYEGTRFLLKNETFFILVRRAGHFCILLVSAIWIFKVFNILFIEKIFSAAIILILAYFANGIANLLIPLLQEKLARNTATHFDDVLLDLFRKFSGTLIYLTGIVLALDAIGLDIMPFIAGAGVVGIAIGFAAKDTLSNLIAGVLLIIDRPFEIGDRIEVWTAPSNSATWGDVVDIGMRATKIRTTDNIIIVIPNNEIMKRDIINYTTITDEIRVRIPIGIAYEADIKEAKKAVEKISYEMDWVMKERPTKVVVRSFGDSSINLEARIWIKDPRRRIDTISYVTDRTKEVFDEHGIEIPYPKRDIIIRKES